MTDGIFLKALSLLFSAGILVIAALAPFFKLRKNLYDRNRKGVLLPSGTLSLCNCFAAGVFLATCFGLILHTAALEPLLHRRLSPAGTFTACHDEAHHGHDHGHHHHGNETHGEGIPWWQRTLVNTNLMILTGFICTLFIEQFVDFHQHSPLHKHQDNDEDHHHHHHHTHAQSRFLGSAESADAETLPPPATVERATSRVQSFFLLLAMSTHSFFEGIAIGAQNGVGEFLRLLVSIMLHEVLCAFAYGVTLANQRPLASTFWAIFSSTILASSISTGAFLMITLGAFMENQTSLLVVRFMLEGLAAGTFIYVACLELLAHEFSHGGGGHSHGGEKSTECERKGGGPGKRLKAGLVVVGAVVAFGVNALLGH